MSAVNATQWTWVGASRRHTLLLHHHTLSGKQDIWLNGVSILSTGWRFRLPGTIQIPADDTNLEIFLLADGERRGPGSSLNASSPPPYAAA